MVLLAEIQDTLRQYGWKRLLLAVSGGLDSICLAHYFITNKEALGIEWIGIAHVHHGLREGTADRDAKFVQKFAAQCGVPFFLKRLDGNLLKASEGSLEENARDARYEALSKFAVENQADAIITAHHAGDQAETLCIRLYRGVTLAGLRGIRQIRETEINPERDSQTPPLPIYRPLLNVTRKKLRDYAHENNLTWCEDESNADTQFMRNHVRHKMLPALETTNAGISPQLCRIAKLADCVYGKIMEAANGVFAPMIIAPEDWPFDTTISPYPKVLALDSAKVQAFIEKTKEITGMAELFRLWLNEHGFRFPIDTFEPTAQTAVHASIHYRTRFIEKCRNILWIYDSALCQKQNNLYFLNDKQRFPNVEGVWRSPTKGDILTPPDMKIKPRPLGQWLQEKGIPHWMRPFLQVLAQGNRVLFVSGLRISKV